MPKNFVGGPLFFGKVLVSKKSWITSYHHFVELFCLTSLKMIVGAPVCVSELFWFQKFLHISGVLLLLIVFVSRRRKSSWVNPSVFQKYSGIKIFRILVVSFFCRSFLSHSAEKLVENSPMIRKSLGHPKFFCKIGVFHDFQLKTFCLTVPKNFAGDRCLSEIFWYPKNFG